MPPRPRLPLGQGFFFCKFIENKLKKIDNELREMNKPFIIPGPNQRQNRENQQNQANEQEIPRDPGPNQNQPNDQANQRQPSSEFYYIFEIYPMIL